MITQLIVMIFPSGCFGDQHLRSKYTQQKSTVNPYTLILFHIIKYYFITNRLVFIHSDEFTKPNRQGLFHYQMTSFYTQKRHFLLRSNSVKILSKTIFKINRLKK